MPWTTFDSAGAAIGRSLSDTPVGTVQPYAGSVAPNGWLMCDGSAVNRTTYAELYSVIGTTFGAGDGSTTFALPDLRGRVPAGKDNMGGSAASRLTNSGTGNPGIDGATLGASGGVDRHTITTAQMPSHAHNFNWSSAGNGAGGIGLTRLGANEGQVGSTSVGSDNAHPNAQPTLVLNYIIYAQSVSSRIATAMPPQYVTSLPSSPVDGQTVVYAADATNGVMWTLRYRAASSSSYKWEFVGGPPLSSQVDSLEYTTSGSYTALTTAGPSITLPLAGDYDIKIGAYIQHPMTQSTYWMSYDIGATGAVDNDGIRRDQYNADTPRSTANNYRTRRKTGLSAVTLTAKYKSGGGANCGWGDRTMIVTPVRVG